MRKLLAKEINDLKAVPRPDTEGIVLTLGSLADSLEGLPLKNAMPDTFREAPAAPAGELSGFARAVATVRAALGSLVSIRRADDPISPLLSDAQKTVLIRSLDLELQLARLAIMRGDAGMFAPPSGPPRNASPTSLTRYPQTYSPHSSRSRTCRRSGCPMNSRIYHLR